MTPDWLADVACRRPGVDPAWFFGCEESAVKALAVCQVCSARELCRADAEAHGDIVDGHTTHGQVVGGCGPYKPAKGEREPVMIQCYLEGCIRWFAKRQGANMYCSKECAVAGRKASQALNARRRRGAA